MAATSKDRLLETLIQQRNSIQKKLTNWADKNMVNPQLESQLMNIDMRIDQLLILEVK